MSPAARLESSRYLGQGPVDRTQKGTPGKVWLIAADGRRTPWKPFCAGLTHTTGRRIWRRACRNNDATAKL